MSPLLFKSDVKVRYSRALQMEKKTYQVDPCISCRELVGHDSLVLPICAYCASRKPTTRRARIVYCSFIVLVIMLFVAEFSLIFGGLCVVLPSLVAGILLISA